MNTLKSTAKPGAERIFDTALDFYWYMADRVATRQDNLFRTYLWVASIFVTLDVLLLQHLPVAVWTRAWCLCLASLTLLLAIILFCLMGLRGHGAYAFPELPGYWGYVEEGHPAAMSTLFDHFWKLILAEIAEKNRRSRLLRAISWGLILSAFFTALSAVTSLP